MLSVEPQSYVYAAADGIFESCVSLGDQVEKDRVAGHIYFPSEPLRAPEPVHFETSGVVVCERSIAMCEVGDCLVHLGHPL